VLVPTDVLQLRPSLVLLDLVLHREPVGYAFLEALRAWPGTKTLPVLVCSGQITLTAPAAERVSALVSGILIKPIDLDLLFGAVRNVLSPTTPAGAKALSSSKRTAAGGVSDDVISCRLSPGAPMPRTDD